MTYISTTQSNLDTIILDAEKVSRENHPNHTFVKDLIIYSSSSNYEKSTE